VLIANTLARGWTSETHGHHEEHKHEKEKEKEARAGNPFCLPGPERTPDRRRGAQTSFFFFLLAELRRLLQVRWIREGGWLFSFLVARLL